MRVALVYDRVNSVGGAERVLQRLHELYPDAPLYTSVYAAQRAPWAQGWDVRTSWLQHVAWARTHHQWFGWLMPLLFEAFDLHTYDLVISVSSEAAKGVLTQPQQRHVCYLLTPTRYLWSHADEYAQTLPWGVRTLARSMQSLLRHWDRVAAQRPDTLIVLSQRVAQRTREVYDREPDAILYPPPTTFPAPKKPSKVPTQPFLLATGRHVSYKRFDLIIRAAVAMEKKLIVLGEGPETGTLHALADRLDPQHRFIEWRGWCTDAELHWWYEHARLAIFPQEEDFGLTTLEALQAGCPVVVNALSGSAECVRPGKDGIYLDNMDVSFLQQAISVAWDHPWDRLDIQRHSLQYAGVHFDQSWKAILKRTEGNDYVTT